MSVDSPLPEPDPEALRVSQRLVRQIQEESNAGGGWLSFRRYMELALYAPGLGYYAAGSHKLGRGGDFVTAPEVSPVFGQCLARQCAQVLRALDGGSILEFGAGSGRLAVDMLRALDDLGTLPEAYAILEPSPDLRQRQEAAVTELPPDLRRRVYWRDTLPDPGSFRGVMLGNEVLDAMPVEVFRWDGAQVRERGVCMGERGLEWAERPAGEVLAARVAALRAEQGDTWPPDYISEWNPGLGPWVRALGEVLERGVLLLLDYGYPRAEYYSAERRRGTLIAHYRHRALEDPLAWPGLMDITANVDFTAVAEAGRAAGLALLGYTTQAWFLVGAGLEAVLAARASEDPGAQAALAAQVRMLTLPSEMGERFQVMALGRGMSQPLEGFTGRDLSRRL
ncbi:class I SAM-dependent methyltransferase [Ectothiorhodospira mobilis]|uniref:class I SAM-dependent methyltransferase n=1 Tax=Ectothiorhodospira mobilis TaxID=195064 RepID=UPI001EE800AF|nr:SAM-dependent methyltransferase [Ectothiorhodospira mobilis]MCG5534479.1 SAM-dependent methyltransferase [Ectothiorhodospira mobilis]